MHRTHIGGVLIAAAIGVMLIVPPIVRSAAADGGPEPGTQLAEVVVTAQKRTEKLQDTPISAQVIAGQSRVEQNFNSLDELSQIVPGVHIGQSGRSDELFVRGIGSGTNQSFDQSVGTFVDDVYHGRSRTSAATFLDLDRVEILKGPQSTYFGNNAIAGALNIVTKKPGDEFDAWARALYGQFGQYAVEGAVGGPVSNTLAVRVAATANGERGWLDNVNTGERQPDQDNQAGRVTVLFRPDESFDATLKIEASENKNHSGLYLQDVNCPPAAPFVPAGFCALALGLHVPTGLSNNANSENPGQELDLSTNDAALTVNLRRWGSTFTSVTGFYGYHYNLNLDSDGTPLTLLNAQVPEHYTQVSQELRVASPIGQPIEYVAGVYYQADHLYFRQDFNYSFLSGTVEGIPPLAVLVPYLPLAQQINYAQDEQSYSAFGSLSWNLTDQLKLTGGLRGNWVHKSFDWNLFYGTATQAYGGTAPLPNALNPVAGALGLGSPGSLNGSRTDHALMPSGILQYKVTPQAMAYLSYAKGFKSGGFNGADNTDSVSNMSFAPEYVNAYEGGLKTEWLNNRVLLNVALFHSDYSNLQVATNVANGAGTFVSTVRNAATSLSQGVELEGQWLVSRAFRLSTNVTYLDAHYVSYPNVLATAIERLQGLSVQDLSGQPTQFAPRWSGSVTGTYTAALPAGYQLITSLSTFLSTDYFSSETGTNDSLHVQNGYARLDGRISVETPDRHWAFDLIGKNLTNQTIKVFIADYPTSNGSTLEQKESPRNWALQFRYHW